MKISIQIAVLLLSLQSMCGQNLYGETGSFSHLFTNDEYEMMTTKRIRREIRDLSDNQWDRIVDAMNIMKNTSESDGREIYGEFYQNYDVLVCQHAITSLGP